jgi:GNAT superfamily N-acetyltransferase
MVMIRPVAASDETAWREMWAGYCAADGTDVPEQVTAATWTRFFDPRTALKCLIAEIDGRSVGFATYVLHPFTWGTNPQCYLEDLFVHEDARGRGVGHTLIAHLVEAAKTEGWDRVYWHTRANNVRARRLYDRFVPADDFVRYKIDTKGRDGGKNVLPFPANRGVKPPHDRDR